MTADIELLPLPKWLLEGFTDPTIEMLCDYTRANVEHYTAAKDAEIEALRAEVAAWRELSDHVRAGACNAIWPDRYTSPSTARVAKALRDLQAEVERLERDGIDGWKQSARNRARAERLAEALRTNLEAVRGALQEAYNRAAPECCGRGNVHGCCGEPEPAWTPEDQAVMDKLGPLERSLSAALRDHDQEVGES